MAINKKLIHFKTKAVFNEKLANNEILDTSIVFIQDSRQIWTHGQLYNCYDQDLSKYLTECIKITYSELKTRRDNSQLIPGAFYRITDYITTTSQSNTQSAGHPFDIVVLALTENTLADEAYAVHSERDTDGYFANSNLSAWKIWYSLDNDTSKFAWADAENGKGVIYRMIDEFGNDCPYDFKNIQFKRKIDLSEGRPKISEDAEETWVYTFAATSYHIDNDEWSGLKDGSLESPYGHMSDENTSTFHHNVMKPWIMNYDADEEIRTNCGKAYLNNNVMFGYWDEIGSTNEENVPYYYAYCCYSNTFGDNCQSNTFCNGCYSNTFGDNCQSNTFGDNCQSNTFGNICGFNTFGNDCNSNTFGNNCNSNSFGNNCVFNTFGDDCNSNSFGNNCNSNSFETTCRLNTFGDRCTYNSFGNVCSSNSFETTCQYNSFGNNCYSNSFDDSCQYNSFGDRCGNNSFGDVCSSNSFGNTCSFNSFRLNANVSFALKNYVQYNHFDDGCSFNVIWNSDTTSSDILLKNINVNRGVSGTSSSYNYINITTLNQDYELQVAKNSSGEIKIYCEADLIA